MLSIFYFFSYLGFITFNNQLFINKPAAILRREYCNILASNINGTVLSLKFLKHANSYTIGKNKIKFKNLHLFLRVL